MLHPPTIEALYLKVAVEVKISQLPCFTVDPNVHTFLTAFYCHFDYPDQYQTMLLPVKRVNSFLPVNVLTTRKV